MITFAAPVTSSPRRQGSTTRLPEGVLSIWLKPIGCFPRLACVDGRLRGHDGSGAFMAETQKLIGVSLEGSVG